MVSPISNQSLHVQPAAAKPVPAAASTAAAQPRAPRTDTVQLSSAAKVAQEAAETPTQTAKEAASGDVQAKHLLAKENAASVR